MLTLTADIAAYSNDFQEHQIDTLRDTTSTLIDTKITFAGYLKYVRPVQNNDSSFASYFYVQGIS